MMDANQLRVMAVGLDSMLEQDAAHLVLAVICDHVEKDGEEVAMIKVVAGPNLYETPRHKELVEAIMNLLSISLGEPIRG